MSQPALRRLKPSERRFLDERLGDRTLSAYVLDRFRIIDAVHRGYNPTEIARFFGCERRTVYLWVYTFNESGFAEFEKASNPYGRPAEIQAWTSAITYLWTREGWLHVVVVLDLFSRSIVGWASRSRIDAGLVCTAFDHSLDRRGPTQEMILHSDRRSQYTSESVETLINNQDISILQSHRFSRDDEAVTESCFHTLKTECVQVDHYDTREDGHSSLFDFIEVFYNRQRRHSSLGYRPPAEMEEHFDGTQNRLIHCPKNHGDCIMQALLLRSFKHFLTLAGRRLPKHYHMSLVATANYLMIGRWMYDHGYAFEHRVNNREEVWSSIAEQVNNRRALYLEFGVYHGESMRYWLRVLKHPETKLHGFDSFEGLPEKGGPWNARQFDTGGFIPVIDDHRVKFFKGWFDEILPTYVVPAHEVLIINMDADLYSSTIFVLRHMRPYIKPGTFVYFDEFNNINNETRAFEEFLAESGLKFRAFCADKTLAFVCFQCID